MYCINCGNQILDGDSFCTNCGALANNNAPVQEPQKVTVVQTNNNTISEEDNKKANFMCILSLLLYIAAPVVLYLIDMIISFTLDKGFTFFSAFSSLSHLAGLALMIVARVKYPKNTFAKVLMWIYIGLMLLSIVIVIVIIIFAIGIIASLL